MKTKIISVTASRRTADLEGVLQELIAIRTDMVAAATQSSSRLKAVHPDCRNSALNLLHYLALRRHDLRPLQLKLAALGLSSLGRAESHVLTTVDAVLGALHRLVNRTWQPPKQEAAGIDFTQGQQLLDAHTDALFGSSPTNRAVRIMVTMPSEAANDHNFVHELMQQGMDCLRINCAHDDTTAWLRMIQHLRRAEKSLGRSCRVVMDLSGPKLRTGPLEPGPVVIKIRPRRDVLGRVTEPARIWLTTKALLPSSTPPASACLTVSPSWLARLRAGTLVRFTDARQSKRVWKVVEVTDLGCWVEAKKTAYLVPGTVLHDKRDTTFIHNLTPSENTILLKQNDLLILTRDLKPGRSAIYDQAGKVLTPAQIGCTIPEVFNDVRKGESIWFDDGKIGGKIEKVENSRVLVRITHARLRGEKLRADKGINLPDSPLRLAAMTPKDIADLSFVAEHADIVELSFANSSCDVQLLQKHLAHRKGRQPAIVLKIETRRSFENLPDMLLTAMRAPSCGVMIARGDLAVECGFERLAEVQEEILWICEAAHVPVIWATQVLETLAKEGIASRAEISDAAMGVRAECVMLNKGPHIQQALHVLDGILQNMQSHQSKKRSMLRRLNVAGDL